MPALPTQVLAGNVYVISQGSGVSSINESLAQNLTRQTWVEIVSPEVLAVSVLRGEPVLVRGVDLDPFLNLENAHWTVPGRIGDMDVAAGGALASRLALRIGENVTLVGSTVPRLEIARIAGVFASDGPANDELLVDLGLARSLTGLGPEAFHTIRVKTASPDALLAFLGSFGSSVHVTGPSIALANVHSDPPTSDRLTNLLLRSGRGSVPPDYVTSAAAEATNSVRVVALGLAALIGGLVVFGIHAVQTRAFADVRGTVGVLRTLGANRRWTWSRLVAEMLPIASAAGVAGALLGGAIDTLARPATSLLLFGHEVHGTFDVASLVLVSATVLAASIGSGLVLLQAALRERPIESIREHIATESPPALEVVLRS